jgi:hypothetical protein
VHRATPLRVTLLLGAACALCGCENIGGLLRVSEPEASQPLARAIDRQIMELDLLDSAPLQERVDIFTTIELDYAIEPSDANRLRLALAKTVQGHPGTDLAAGRRELQALLEAPNTLSPTQVHLANIAGRIAGEQLVQNSELTELRAKLASYESANTAQNSQSDRRVRELNARLRALEDDKLRLEEELAQAQSQLDAIMSIETSSDPGN